VSEPHEQLEARNPVNMVQSQRKLDDVLLEIKEQDEESKEWIKDQQIDESKEEIKEKELVPVVR